MADSGWWVYKCFCCSCCCLFSSSSFPKINIYYLQNIRIAKFTCYKSKTGNENEWMIQGCKIIGKSSNLYNLENIFSFETRWLILSPSLDWHEGIEEHPEIKIFMWLLDVYMLASNVNFENTRDQTKQVCGPTLGQFTTFEMNRHIAKIKKTNIYQFMSL